MPKVEVDNLTIAVSPLTKTVYAGVSKENPVGPGMMWHHKKDITQDFLHAVVQLWENSTAIIESDTEKWEVTVKKLK